MLYEESQKVGGGDVLTACNCVSLVVMLRKEKQDGQLEGHNHKLKQK